MSYDVSEAGLRFIANEEGQVKRDGKHVLYNDPLGFATIGWGHLIHRRPVDNCSVCESFRGGLTDAEALALKKADAQRFVRALNELVTVPVSQVQFDALVSLTFNIGEGEDGFAGSTVRRRLNTGDYAGAADAFRMWNKGEVDGKLVELPGLTARRNREREMFMSQALPGPVLPKEKHVPPVLLFARHSRLVLDAVSGAGGMHDAGAGLVQNRVHLLPNQRWVIEDVGNGEVRIRSAASGLVLDVAHFGTENGSPIHLWFWHGGTNQRWRLVTEGDGFFIESVGAPGKVLDVAGMSTDVPAAIHLWERHGGANQIFETIHVDPQDVAPLAEAPAPPPPPDVPPPPPATDRHPDPVGQIEAWGFDDGVAGFQQAFAHFDLVVDGKAGPRTAEAVALVVARGGKLSEFFSINELRSKGNGRVKSHRQLLRRLDEVRRRKGSFTPVSGYRDPAHNKRVGGASNSQHVYGTACDIPEGLGLTVAEARDIGFSGIGRCGNIVLHGDVRAEGPNNTTGGQVGNPTIWDYC